MNKNYTHKTENKEDEEEEIVAENLLKKVDANGKRKRKKS